MASSQTTTHVKLGLLRKRPSPLGDQVLKKVKKTCQEFSYLIVIDFESTCWQTSNGRGRMQEIIEFPAVLLNTSTGKIESEFHYYVQPQEHPLLSPFCRELTGITQDQVDQGIPLAIVLRKFSTWLKKQSSERCITYDSLSSGTNKCTFVTWSDWDLAVCLQYEARRKQIRTPQELNSWIDLRATYRKFYQRRPQGLNGALQDLGIEFEGREHSGLCDARNTAKLAWRMMTDGCILQITKSLTGSKDDSRPNVAKNTTVGFQNCEGNSACDVQQPTNNQNIIVNPSSRRRPSEKSANTGTTVNQCPQRKPSGPNDASNCVLPVVLGPISSAFRPPPLKTTPTGKENIAAGSRSNVGQSNSAIVVTSSVISNSSTFVPKSFNQFKTPNEQQSVLTRKPFGAVNTMRTPSDSMNKKTPPTLCKRTPPMCECGRRAHRKIVQNPGPNQGRAFFACPNGKRMSNSKKSLLAGQTKQWGCRFFKWDKEDCPETSPVYAKHDLHNQSSFVYGNSFLRNGPIPQPDFGPSLCGR